MYDLLWTTIARLFAKDRRPQDQRTSRRTKLVRFGLLLVVFGVVACGYVVRRYELLNINSVEVQGAVRLAPADLAAQSDLVGKNLLTLPGGRAEQRLEALPYVQDARVAKTPSRVAHITVVERTPALLYLNKAGAYLVDDAGVVLELAPRLSGLPVLELDDARRLVPGTRLDPEQVAFVLGLYAQLPEEVHPVVSRLKYDPALGYELVSGAGWRAVLGDSTRIGVKAEVLRRVLATTEIELVDVSAPATPFYRVKGAEKAKPATKPKVKPKRKPSN